MAEQKTHHMSTSDGRDASAAGRRRALTEKPPRGAPRLFIVRLGAGPTLRFGWEIRRFGSFVLSKSGEGYATQPEAKDAGQKALESMLVSEPPVTLSE